MGLAREALRLATVRALRGRTWATVLDSEGGTIEDLAANATKPVVAVYTDDGALGSGGDFLANGEQTLLIEIAMTRRMNLGDDGDQVIQPVTDAALELSAGFIERQIAAALSDPANAWAAVWRKLAMTVSATRSVRGTLMREGIRFAGRQLQITLTLIRDPAPGAVPAAGVWPEFIALLEAEPGADEIAQRFREAIIGGAADWPEWQRSLALFGLGFGDGRALGLMPPPDAVATSPDFAPDLNPDPNAEALPSTFTLPELP